MDALPKSERDAVLAVVAKERGRQDEQWGGPEHDDTHTPFEWLGNIEKQIRVARASHMSGAPQWRERFIKIAALAVAAVEAEGRATEPMVRWWRR